MKAYENMGINENLGWCAPYASGSFRVECSINEGSFASLRIDGEDVDITPDNLKRAAEIAISDSSLNFSSDDFAGESPESIIREACKQLGCRSCPWRDECEAMHVDEDECVATTAEDDWPFQH